MWLLLALLGWFNLYSASYQEGHPSIFDTSREYGMQFLWLAFSAGAGAIILIIEGNFFRTFSYHIYGFFMLLLIAVILFGAERNGATSWFGIGSVGIQPSEFAKFATALALARFLSAQNVKVKDMETKVATGLFIGVPAFLILLQPDMGTVLVFVSFILVLYREGLSGNYLLLGLMAIILGVVSLVMMHSQFSPFGLEISGEYLLMIWLLIVGGVIFFLIRRFILPRFRRASYIYLIVGLSGSLVFVAAVPFLFKNIAAPHQQERVLITLGLKEDPQGSGYNMHQALSAIGSGGFSGKGYQQGTLSNNKFNHVPMQSTDFIFCSIGEEWGWLGSSFVVILFMVFLGRIVWVAERQRSKFTRIYGYSVACILFFHLMINVGMAIGLAPVIGIPLPFFSYGGSSLLAFTVLLFIFLRLDSERMEVLR